MVMAMGGGAICVEDSKISDIVIIVALICVTVLEAINLIYNKIDGTILSAIIGAIVFLATRKYYKPQ